MHRPKISTVCNPKPVDTLRPDSRPGIKTTRTNRSQSGRKTSLCCGISECLILAKAHTILPHSCMVCIVSRLDRFLRRLRYGSVSSCPCVTNSATYIRMQLAIALTSPCYKFMQSHSGPVPFYAAVLSLSTFPIQTRGVS